jgi:hypothetical protein
MHALLHYLRIREARNGPDCPRVYSPSPFLHATLHSAELTVSALSSAKAQGPATLIKLNGIILPTSTLRLHRLDVHSSDVHTYGETRISSEVIPSTVPFNSGSGSSDREKGQQPGVGLSLSVDADHRLDLGLSVDGGGSRPTRPLPPMHYVKSVLFNSTGPHHHPPPRRGSVVELRRCVL